MLFFLFFIVVFDQTAPSVCHLVQAVGQAFAHLLALHAERRWCARTHLVYVKLIRLFPDIVSHELVHGLEVALLHEFNLDHVHSFDQARHVLD